MSRLLWISGILVVSFTLTPSFARSEEAEAPAAIEQPAATEEIEAESPAPEAPEGEAPVAVPELPVVPPPALKPITITFSGDLTSVSPTENPPMVTVQDRYGVKKEISVPAEAKVTAGGAAKTLAELKTGDKVTVEYTYDVATGKRTAQLIGVGEAASTTQ